MTELTLLDENVLPDVDLSRGEVEHARLILAIGGPASIISTFPSAPRDSRCGYLVPVEGNRWLVSITELQCPRPPRVLAEFLDAARRLRTRTTYDAIKNARPAGMPQRYGFPASSWRHYETVVDFQQRLIPIGDALCRFNRSMLRG